MKVMFWMVRRYGPIRTFRYERARRKRERDTNIKFDPKVHGEGLLRAVGADDLRFRGLRERGWREPVERLEKTHVRSSRHARQ